MLNPLLLFAAHITAILSVLLLAVGFLKAEPRATHTRVFAVLAVFIGFYLINGMAAPHIDPLWRINPGSWNLLTQTGSNAIPGLFMIYCFLVFQEDRKFPFIFALGFALQVMLDLVLGIRGVEDSRSMTLMETTLDILQLTFAGLGVYWTLKGWRADLVEARRALRWFTITVQGILIFVIVFLENFLLSSDAPGYGVVQAVIVWSIALIALGLLVAAMRFDYVSLSRVISKVTDSGDENAPENMVTFDAEGFNRVFRDGKLYREAGLTISSLAKKLNLPEYRLRAFIHKQLGFRNFNAMLHKYRIEEASSVLADGKNRNLPVLTIALSVGYQSITPFNNAFREITGVTPSEYRKQSQQRP
ncbi:MAG: AraC family transcriptional regulator [Pseudohongiellaceae bacterium]